MKLSMWILSDWLEKYHPVVKIQDGEANLQNVRLFSDDIIHSRSTVYLYQMDANNIICSNGNDIISIKSDDINQILNELLNAFDYYNEWENTLYARIREHADLDELFSISTPVMNCYYELADASFYIYKHGGDDSVFGENQAAREVFYRNLLPVDSLITINEMKHIRLPNQKTYYVDLPIVNTISATTNLFAKGIHQGWLVTQRKDNQFSKGYFDVQDVFARIIEYWMEFNQRQDTHHELKGLWLKLLNNSYSAKDRIPERLKAFSWGINDTKQIYYIRPDNDDPNFHYALEKHLETLAKNSFLIPWETGFVYIINHALTDLPLFESNLSYFLYSYNCSAGKSPLFEDVYQTFAHHKAAMVSVEYASTTGQRLHEFKDAVIPYCTAILNEHSVINILHPALKTLYEYDQKHETELFETLFVFLQNDRNYTDTANALSIHRSTLIYRLERIVALAELDLDDPKQRFLLLLSFYMNR